MKWLKTTLIALIFAAASVGAYYVGRFLSPAEPGPRRPAVDPHTMARMNYVLAPGKIQPHGGLYDVFAPQGQVVLRYLENQDGQKIDVGVNVQEGAELVELSGQRLLKQQEKLASAKSKDARTEIDAQITGAKLQVRTAELALQEARLKLAQVRAEKDQTVLRKNLDNAKAKLRRLKNLAEDPDTKDLISQQQLTDQELALEKAEIELAKGAAEVERAEQAAVFAEGVAERNLEDARQALADAQDLRQNPPAAIQAAEQLAETQTQLSKITAPITGRVLEVFVKEGQSVVNSPLLQIGNIDRMQCVASVSDRLIGRVQTGDPVRIMSPAFGHRSLSGKVVRISRMVGSNAMRLSDPLALMDTRTVDVTIEIDNADIELAARFINLQVDVEIDVADDSSSNPQR